MATGCVRNLFAETFPVTLRVTRVNGYQPRPNSILTIAFKGDTVWQCAFLNGMNPTISENEVRDEQGFQRDYRLTLTLSQFTEENPLSAYFEVQRGEQDGDQSCDLCPVQLDAQGPRYGDRTIFHLHLGAEFILSEEQSSPAPSMSDSQNI